MGRLQGLKAALLEEQEVRLGTTVLGYCLQEVLGVGSCAVVFRAVEPVSQAQCVIKLARARAWEPRHRAMTRARFENEYEIGQMVDHRHLVQIHELGYTEQGLPALRMEYVPGQTLRQVLMELAPLPAPQVARLGLSLASGLKALHRAGIIHRDVNPNNIISTPGASPKTRLLKLVDFGVARKGGGEVADPGPVGTPMYMAPEQFYHQAWDTSDIFSVGAVLWWALTGQEFRQQEAERDHLLEMNTGASLPPDPRDLVPETPEVLASLVQQMLMPTPQHRPNAYEVYERIKRHLMRELRAGRKSSDTLPQLDVTALRASSEEHSLVEEHAPHSLYRSARPHRTPTAEMHARPTPLIQQGGRWLQILETSLQMRDFSQAQGWALRLAEEASAAQVDTVQKLAEALAALCRAHQYDESMALYQILRSCYRKSLSAQP